MSVAVPMREFSSSAAFQNMRTKFTHLSIYITQRQSNKTGHHPTICCYGYTVSGNTRIYQPTLGPPLLLLSDVAVVAMDVMEVKDPLLSIGRSSSEVSASRSLLKLLCFDDLISPSMYVLVPVCVL